MTNLYADISEKAFQRQVVELAQLLGWEWLHVSHSPQVNRGVVTRYTTPTQGTMRHWPDLILVRERDKRLLFVELKSEAGKISPEQRRVLGVLRSLVATNVVGDTQRPMVRVDGAAVEVYVWRPHEIDTIASILA